MPLLGASISLLSICHVDLKLLASWLGGYNLHTIYLLEDPDQMKALHRHR